MPIEIACPSCQKRMRAPDAAAGKHVKCPACQAPILIPSPRVAATVERWTLLTEDDQQFGPVPRTELDEWFAEGRISAQCQLLREGAPAWQWAPEVYPSLNKKPAFVAAADPLATAPRPYIAPQPTYAAPSTRNYTAPRHSAHKNPNLAAMMAYVGGGAIAVRAVIWIIFQLMSLAGLARMNDRFATATAFFVAVMWLLVIVVASAAGAAPYFFAAVGLSRYRQWGKIMGFVTAGLSVVIALYAIAMALTGLIHYTRMSSIAFALPAEFHLRQAGGILLDLLFAAAMIAHTIVTLMFLLNAKNAHSFNT